MKRSRFLYLSLFLLAAILSIAYKSTLTSVLVLFLLFIPLFSLLIAIIGRFFLKVEIQATEYTLQRTEIFSIPLVLKNRGILPLATVYVLGNLPYASAPAPKPHGLLFYLAPFRTAEFFVRGDFIHRGKYNIYFQNVWIYDPLHLWRLKKRLKVTIPVSVYPKRMQISTAESNSDEQETGRIRNGQKNNIFSSLREYREGDTLRHVHWKLSAKHDELIVRQQEENLNATILILADLNSYSFNPFSNMVTCDVIIESALALAVAAMRDGGSANVLYLSEDTIKKYSITDASNYHEAYQASIHLKPPGQIIPVTHLFSHPACSGAETGTVFFLTSSSDPVVVNLFLQQFKHVGKTPVYLHVLFDSSPLPPERQYHIRNQGAKYISIPVECPEQALNSIFQLPTNLP